MFNLFFFQQLATPEVSFTEGERLAQELQVVEAGIREKEDVCNWNPLEYSNTTWTSNLTNQNSNEDFNTKEVSVFFHYIHKFLIKNNATSLVNKSIDI